MHFFLFHSLVASFQFGYEELFDNFTSSSMSKIWAILRYIWRATVGFHGRKVSGGTYALNEWEEQAYWKSAMRWNLRLQTSGDMKDRPFPVITSYIPTPPAPATHEDETEATEYYLPSKAFCKWHLMVFPESPHHPTLSQAQRLKTRFSDRDRREIHRISRLLCDEVVFGTHRRWSSEYSTMWKLWMEKKGADMVIVFANQGH